MKSSSIIIFLLMNTLSVIKSTNPLYSTIMTLSMPIIEQGGSSSQERVENTFLRWLQTGGVDLISVHTWTTEETIDELLGKVNGVVLMGYPEELNKESLYYKKAQYIIQKVVKIAEESEGKTLIPVLAIGNDASLMTTVLTGETDYITSIKNTRPNRLIFEDTDVAKKSLIFQELDPEDFVNLVSLDILANKMSFGITKGDFKKNAKLNELFDIIATSKNNEGEYVSVIQNKKYPIIGLTFHPEKIVFEQNLIDYVPDSYEAMKASRLIGNSFTIYARTQNERTMTEEEKKQYDFIEPYENYPTFWFGTYQYLYNNTK